MLSEGCISQMLSEECISQMLSEGCISQMLSEGCISQILNEGCISQMLSEGCISQKNNVNFGRGMFNKNELFRIKNMYYYKLLHKRVTLLYIFSLFNTICTGPVYFKFNV